MLTPTYTEFGIIWKLSFLQCNLNVQQDSVDECSEIDYSYEKGLFEFEPVAQRT